MERFENKTLGPRFSLRLDDFRTWDRLQAVCFACDHKTTLNPAALRRRMPTWTKIIEIEKRLKCRRCGNRAHNSLLTGRLARG